MQDLLRLSEATLQPVFERSALRVWPVSLLSSLSHRRLICHFDFDRFSLLPNDKLYVGSGICMTDFPACAVQSRWPSRTLSVSRYGTKKPAPYSRRLSPRPALPSLQTGLLEMMSELLKCPKPDTCHGNVRVYVRIAERLPGSTSGMRGISLDELTDGLLATICKCNGHRYRGLEERHVSEMPMLCGFVSRNSIPYGLWMLGLCLHVLRILICHLVWISVNATASRLYVGFLIQCHLYPLIGIFCGINTVFHELLSSSSVTCSLLCVKRDFHRVSLLRNGD